MIHVNITITGKVQRIGFRFTAMQIASELGVRGFVMYVDKDKLYIEAEGPRDKVEEFKNWCRNGPCSAHIRQFSIDFGECKDFKTFEILNSRV